MNSMFEPDRSFNPAFFERLKMIERFHFWFKVRNQWIFDKIAKYMPPPAKLLEVGCGTGNVSSYLSRKGYEVTGCEYYQEALGLAWPGFTAVQGDALDLPFDDNSFDIVGLFDVIEHFDDDRSVISEAQRVVREGGIIAITVPAQLELLSRFDEISHHRRRYSKEHLKNIILEKGLRPRSVEHIFMSLYLPAKYLRNQTDTNSYFNINVITNAFLSLLCNIERIFSKFTTLPIGTSLACIAEK